MDEELTYPRSCKAEAFSIVELLLVMGIMILLAALATPAVTSILAGSNLERAGDMVSDTLALARQEAVASNHEMQVAFYQVPTGATAPAWNALQIWEVTESSSGPVTKPAGPLLTLPSPMIISSNATYSPLITNANLSGNTTVAGHSNVKYAAFRFHSNGTADSSIGQNNYLTVQNSAAKGNPPPNYFAVQVNPITGKITIIRP